MQKKIVLLVGNIGAGKSTLIEKLSLDMVDGIILCEDDLRGTIGYSIGKEYIWDEAIEELIRSITVDMVEAYLIAGTPTILIDELNLSLSCRGRFIDLAHKYEYKVEARVLPTLSREVAVSRRMNDPRGYDREYWGMVWDKGMEDFIFPTTGEGLDKVTYD